ncbi:MAG: hypothetical protein JOY61_12315 [Chloroflexi bacterium]|nr:hypothetical protein [Chloroflexota bacterium]
MRLSANLKQAAAAAVLFALIVHTADAHDPGVGIVRYNPDGTLDQSFGNKGIVSERTPQGGLDPEALVLQADGKILLAGTTSDLTSATVGFGLARYNSDGSLDTSFGSGGRVLTLAGQGEADAHAVVLQPDGSILVAGSAFADKGGASQFAIARYTSSGSLDPSFGSGGLVLTSAGESGAEARGIALQSDGRIAAVGTSFGTADHDDAFALVRYMPDGSLDTSFGDGGTIITEFTTPSGPARGNAIIVQPDGMIFAAGSAGGHAGSLALVRYTTSGTAAPTATQLQASAQGYALAPQPDGRVLVAGAVGSADSQSFCLTRYLADGNLDASFGNAGTATTSFDGGGSGAHGVLVQPDGKVVLVGSGSAGFAAARYTTNGSLDPTFGSGGKLVTMVSDAGSFPAAVAMQPDGKLISVGLTYFYVPPPDSGPPWWQIAALVVIAAVLVTAVVGSWMRKRARAATGRTGPAPEASPPVR